MSTLVYPTIAKAVAAARHIAVAPLTWNPVEHLLSRFTFGPTAALRTQVQKLGYDGWFAHQLSQAAKYPGYSGSSAVGKAYPQLLLSPYDAQQWMIAQNNEYGSTIMDQLTYATLGLQIWSAAPLYETLVDFWSNHLNVANHSDDLWNTRQTHDLGVVRKYATGTFTDMLLASAKNPAMLQYLNLAESTKDAVNENYGRELLELHTVGLHYTESDVKNVAKLLTGRTLDDYQHYLFDDYIHGTGAVKVLGFRNANADATQGEAAGDLLIRYLAAHPDTAQHLAYKLCLRYVSDTPSTALVAAVAKAYTDNKTAIVPMISTILRSTEFWESRGLKVRRPTENLIAAIRVLGITPKSLSKAVGGLWWATSQLGNIPLDWPAPNGYPDVAAAWRSSGTLLQLWNMHLTLTGGWWDGLRAPNLAALYPKATTSGDAITAITTALSGAKWDSASRNALQKYLNEPASTPIASSALQWSASSIVALALDSPHHALR